MLKDHQKLFITKTMTTKHPLLDRWVRVLMNIDPKGKIPNINTATTKNMSFTVLEKLKLADPELYESVFATPIEKIEDGRLQQHLYDGNFWTDDEEGLRANGYEHKANMIAAEKIKYQNDKINKEIEESRQRQAIQQKERERWENMSLLERMHEESKTQTTADIINAQLKYHGRVGT